MSDQSDRLLADILATQKRILEIEEQLLANSNLAVARQRHAVVWFVPFIVLVVLLPYLPWLIRTLFGR